VKRLGVRRWLPAARHPARRDFMIALALLAVPWFLGWALAHRHHLDVTVVTILVAVTIPLATLWLTYAGVRNALTTGPADSATGNAIVTAEPIGPVVYQPRRGVTGKPVRLADPPSLLAGREDLLAEVDARLTGGDDSGPRTVVLSGLGGAGKTSVVLAYAHRHLAEVGVAWRFAAEDPTVLAAGFGELAAQLGARDSAGDQDPVASVHGTLAAFPEQWLLIFDNVPDRASVERFLPPAGQGRVFITSRNPGWPPGQVLAVPVLDTEVAAGFLADRTGDRDKQAASELAAELGGLPLALEQAGAYIQASGGSLARYLALFRKRRPEMLARGEPTGYSQTVATTWRLAFEDVQQAAPVAAGLLRLLAFCAPEAIPLRRLLQPRPELAGRLGDEVAPVLAPLLDDELAAGDAIAALRRYSLISPPADGAVSVHRLVQAVTADQMPAELVRQWRQAAAVLIEDAIPDDTHLPEAWQMCAVLLPHTQTALADDSDGMAWIANYLGSSGNYRAARDLQRRVVVARERILGPEHPRTLDASDDLATWTGEAGDVAAARDQFVALVPIHERVLGPEHPQTLAVRASLARWTGVAGNPDAARDLYAALLPVYERILGPEHPRTLDASDDLATWTGVAGNPDAAREQYATAVPVRERVSGPEYPRTLAAPRQPRRLDRAGGRCGQRRGAVRRAGTGDATGPRPGAPGHPGRPLQPRPLGRAGREPGRRPGPDRRAYTNTRAGLWPGAPGDPGRPRQLCPLDRRRRGCRRRPGPVHRTRARIRAGNRPGAPGHPVHPHAARRLDRGRGGSRRRPGPVRRAAACIRADPRPEAPGHPEHPHQPLLLARAGGAWPSEGVK
jgi:Tetratricopeptide repeat